MTYSLSVKVIQNEIILFKDIFCQNPSTNSTSTIEPYNQLAPHQEKTEIVHQSAWSSGSDSCLNRKLNAS